MYEAFLTATAQTNDKITHYGIRLLSKTQDLRVSEIMKRLQAELDTDICMLHEASDDPDKRWPLAHTLQM